MNSVFKLLKTPLSNTILAILITILLYLIFFFPILKYQNFFWDSDAEVKHYPAREYLYRSLTWEKRFPLYTERVLFGHALYRDLENAYMNPVNVLTILLMGPVISFKFVHFFSVLIGGISLYFFLRRNKIGLIGYVASYLVYYYSFFHLKHLIHFNMIAVSLLLPLNILLVDLYLASSKKKYIFLQSLLLGYQILWGHPQTFTLIVLAIALYVLINKFNKKNILYLCFVFLLGFSIAMFQIIPSATAYFKSVRNTGEIKPTQGSLTPLTSLSYIFPYIYSTFPYYYGEDINGDYSYTETYHYVGIVALTLFAFYLLFGDRDKYFWFSYSLFICFLILGYLDFLPIPLFRLPGISSFRYWTRSIFLFDFGVALLVARVLMFKKFRFNNLTRKYLVLVIGPLIFLLIVHLLNLGNSTIVSSVESIVNYRFDLLQKKLIFVWLLLPTLLCLLLLFAVRLRNNTVVPIIIPYLILILIVFDYVYFSSDVLGLRIKEWRWESGLTFPFYYDNKRVIDEKVYVKGMKPLQRDVYTPYGYTQFVENNYASFFNALHLGKSLRSSYTEAFAREELDLEKIKTYGITYYRTREEEYILRNPTSSTFLRDESPVKYLHLKDGDIKMIVQCDSEELYTTIKYDPNWKVLVNNVPVPVQIWENLFMKLVVPRGENIIEFKYVPYDIYAGGLVGALVFTSLSIYILRGKD